MGKIAILEVETYNNGQGTRIRFDPGNINPYTLIGVFESMIVELKNRNAVTEKRCEFNSGELSK